MPHKPSGGQGVGAPQPQSSTPTAASLLRARTEPPRQPAELAKKARARIRGPIGGLSTGVPTNPAPQAHPAARVEPEQEEHIEDCIIVRTSLDSADESDL